MDSDNKRKLWVGLPAIGAVAAAAAIGGSAAIRRARRDRPHDDAPGWDTHSPRFGSYALSGNSITINRPRDELYAFWKEFQNLARFMENLESVQPTGAGGTAVWTIKAPGGRTVDVETRIAKDEDNRLIAWQSVPGSDIKTKGRVEFEDAPGGRGTKVTLIVAYESPFGDAGRVVAKAFRREPKIQARHDLKRFKMLMETGEIATSARTHSAEKE